MIYGGMRDRSMRSGTKLAREIQLTDWSTAGNLSNRSSGVQIPRDICTRFGRYLYSTKCSWIISSLLPLPLPPPSLFLLSPHFSLVFFCSRPIFPTSIQAKIASRGPLFRSVRTGTLATQAILVYCRFFLFINFLFLILRWPYIFVLCLYRINKQRDRSLEFSSILSTVDLSKHLIMVESFVQKFIQLVNFVTFRSSFPFPAIEYG